MFDDGIDNDFEKAHQSGLTRGFDLGWSYKGKFDRQLIKDKISKLESETPKDTYAINVLHDTLTMLRDHDNNREFITNR
jgi:hypothetical protein